MYVCMYMCMYVCMVTGFDSVNKYAQILYMRMYVHVYRPHNNYHRV